VNPLLRSPTTGEATLLDVIYQAWGSHNEWPYFQYVDSTLYKEFRIRDAQSVILGCPRVSVAPSGIGHYGWIRSSNPTLSAQLPEDKIALTVGGLARLPQAAGTVAVFLQTLAHLVEVERSASPSPTQVDLITVTSDEVQKALWRNLASPALVRTVGELLAHEPSTWGCNVQPNDEGGWTASPRSFLRRYEGITNVSDYLDRLLEQLAPYSPEPASTESSALGSEEPARHQEHDYDFFISHASPDKDAVARPLYRTLANHGYRVWFDEAELKLGDSLLKSIDRGLANCRHGIVILSPAFFGRSWPERELAGLVQRADSGSTRVILPVWHNVDKKEVTKYSPILADLYAVSTRDGVKAVVDAIIGSM
jgi:hypothetical protein